MLFRSHYNSIDVITVHSELRLRNSFRASFCWRVEWDAFDVLDAAESESVGLSWAFSCPSGSFLELLSSSSNASWAFDASSSFS